MLSILRFNRFSLLALLIMASLPLSADESWQEQTLLVCSEDAGWPPFSFMPAQPDAQFSGFNQDVMAKIFTAQGIRFEVKIKPWKRCLQDGLDGTVHIILDGASNPQREKDYLFTRQIYSLKPVYFLSKQHRLASESDLTLEDLKSLKVCGQKGYTYTNFGFNNDKVAQISKDLHKVLDLTRLSRCDIGLGREEVLRAELTSYDYGSDLVIRPVPGASEEAFFWLLSRQFENVQGLKQHIDANIERLYESGEAQMLMGNYF